MKPFTAIWNGSSFQPLLNFQKCCRAEYITGKAYRLVEAYDRSMSSHNHYFARVYDLWNTRPERWKDKFPSDDHMRKWALIKCGYCTDTVICCASKAEAIRFAAYLRLINTYAIAVVDGKLVYYRVAKSQSVGAMKPKEFQESKTAVLDYLEGLLGVSHDDEGGNAA